MTNFLDFYMFYSKQFKIIYALLMFAFVSMRTVRYVDDVGKPIWLGGISYSHDYNKRKLSG